MNKPTEVQPIGTQPAAGFVTRESGCGVEEWIEPVYPPSPRGDAIRELRKSLELSLREAAYALAVTPSELSGLEFGRLAWSERDWDAAYTALVTHAKFLASRTTT